MHLTNYFDIYRFLQLLKIEIFRSRKGIGIIFVAVFGMLFFIGLLLAILVETHKLQYDHHENYGPSLLLGGCILSSLAFQDLGSPLKRPQYLTLPVSTLEKFLCLWLLTSVGWIALFTLAYVLYTLLANVVGHVWFSHISFQSFHPLSHSSWTAMRVYFVVQGIFLVGAAHFNGYVFPKTVFVLVIVGLVWGLLAYFILKDVFLSDHRCDENGCELVDAVQVHSAWLITQWLFWWVLAPVCWLATYLGLKDKEV